MSHDRAERGLRWLSDVLCLAGGWALLALSFWIVVNVLLRKFLSFSFQGVDEYGGYCLAIASAAAFAKAAFDRAHVRIDAVTRLVPAAGRAALDVVALVSLGGMMWLIAWKAIETTYESWEMGALATSPLRTHLWIPQALWAAGLAWFAIVLVFQCIGALKAIARRDWATIEEKFGHTDVQREVEAELKDARERMHALPKDAAP
jgi:TRAP-type C4-dicarboxylate transport system permease small subunit